MGDPKEKKDTSQVKSSACNEHSQKEVLVCLVLHPSKVRFLIVIKKPVCPVLNPTEKKE